MSSLISTRLKFTQNHLKQIMNLQRKVQSDSASEFAQQHQQKHLQKQAQDFVVMTKLNQQMMELLLLDQMVNQLLYQNQL